MRVEAGALVRTTAARFGSRPALTSAAGSMSFTELNQAANQVGSALHDLGVQRGDRVGVLAYNTPEVVTAWLGFEKHNLVRAVLHSHFTMDAHVASLNHIEASAMVFDTRFTDQVEDARPQLTTVRHFVAIGPDTPGWAQPFADLQAAGQPDDPYLDVDEDAPCFLQLTSGTTGHPKAWVKSYRSWAAVIDHNLYHLDTFGPGIPPVGADDVNLHFHAIQWASASRPSTRTCCAAPGRCCWTTRRSTPTNCSTRSPSTRPPASSCPARCSPPCSTRSNGGAASSTACGAW